MTAREKGKTAASRVTALAAGIYTLSVAFSVYLLELKRRGLQFHTRDYNYFVEQAARLADPQLKDQFALNIEGYNFLGLQGVEGAASLIHAIHTEYFRYSYAALYALFRSPLALYIFYSLVFFLPVIYIAFLYRRSAFQNWRLLLLFILLYCLFPATFFAVTADLRPRLLFIPAWCLVVLAVAAHRPFLEKLLLFGLLLSIREEGIILGAGVLALNFIWTQGKPGRWKQTALLFALDLAALAFFLWFMRLGGYTRVDAVFDPRIVIRDAIYQYWYLGLAAAAAALLGMAFVWRRRSHYLREYLFLLVYLGMTAVSGFQAFRETLRLFELEGEVGPVTLGDILHRNLTDPLLALWAYLALLLLVLLLEFTRGAWKGLLQGFLVGLCLFFAAYSLSALPPRVAEWRAGQGPARLVWDFVNSHDRYETDVLADYDTYQAFYNFDRVLVFNRLPLWDTLPEKRYYPENRPALVRLVRERLEYVVIARHSLEEISSVLEEAGVQARTLAENETYTILRLLPD